MTKRNVYSLLIAAFCFSSGSISVAAPGIGNKVSGLSDKNYREFSGFSFDVIPSSEHKESLKVRVNSEIDYVIQDDIEKGHTGRYAIVGHSQGGIRVLAYAAMLERRINDPYLTLQEREEARANYERLRAVITISGIDKGLKALENNFSTLKAKATEDGNIWLNGIHGVAKITIVTTLIEKHVMNKIGISSAGDIVDKIDYIYPGFADSYIKQGWNSASYPVIAEIYDMVPGSAFIRENVSDTTSVTYKKQTGTRKYTRWEKVSWCWWWWVTHEEPVYTTYTAYKDNPKFSGKLPVGYIVGTNSNTLSLAGDKEQIIRSYCKTASNVFEAAQILNHVRTYLAFGFLTGHYNAYRDCCTARDWFCNVDGELNELKGSAENDGLVAKENQFFPKQFYNPATGKYEEVHSNVLGKKPKGYVEIYKNHRDINCEETFNDVVFPMLKEAGVIKK